MPIRTLPRLVYSFRRIATVLLVWVGYNSAALAWQSAPNAAPPARLWYPGYRFLAQPPVFYPARPVYRQPGYYPVYPRWPNPGYAPGYPQQRPVQPATRPGKLPAPSSPSANVPKKPDTQSTNKDRKTGKPTDKQAFVDRLLPIIRAENNRLRQQRQQLQHDFAKLDRGQSLSKAEQVWLKNLARQYRVKEDPIKNIKARTELLSKVDVIPPSLALAQAANESAWGKSRFASEANNLFGIWTYDSSKGIVPQQRDSGKKHLIRKFDHFGDSITFYMRTLNSHPAYQKLRELRRQARLHQQPLDGRELAKGLSHYSARGQAYIDLIVKLIEQNRWAKLDRNPADSAV